MSTEPLRVFVASSSEQITLARAVAAALASPQLDVKVWDEETFDFSASYIESLENELDHADFAVVILTADDSANVRSKTVNLPRDNVVFELGLFTGRLGRSRCFFLLDGASDTQVASDLSGVNPVMFRRDGDAMDPGRRSLEAQLKRLEPQIMKQGVRYKPSADVRSQQNALWRFSSRVAGHWWERMRAREDDSSALSYVTITVDEVTNTPELRGWSYGLRGERLADWRTIISGVVLGKEPAIHYRWEGEHDTQHGQTFGGGGYIVFDDSDLNTASGYFYDTNFARIVDGAHTKVKHYGIYRCDPRDVDVMSKPWREEAQRLIGERLASLQGR